MFYRVVQNTFRYCKPFRRGSRDGWTDRRTNRLLLAIAWSINRAKNSVHHVRGDRPVGLQDPPLYNAGFSGQWSHKTIHIQ